MSALCPVCSKDDKIQKLSSIVIGGVSSGTFAGPTGGITYSDGKVGSVGGYSRLSGTSTTALAQRLAPPVKPSVHVSRGLQILTACLWLFFVMFLCVSSGFYGSDATGATMAIVVLLILACLSTWGVITQNQNGQEDLPRKIGLWEKQMVIYDRLYYCHRDDVVFDSIGGRGVPSQEFQKLLAGD